MITTGEQTTTSNEEHCNVEISERRLWAAVLLQAIEDWRSTNVRRQNEAERFFFKCEKDFATVCRGAGLEPDAVLSRLRKMKQVNQTATRIPAYSYREGLASHFASAVAA